MLSQELRIKLTKEKIKRLKLENELYAKLAKLKKEIFEIERKIIANKIENLY